VKKKIIVYLFLILMLLPVVNANANNQGTIYVIPIKGEVNYALEKYVEKGINEAKASNAQKIIFEIDTYGGAINNAIEISNDIINSGIPTVSYIVDNSISAGVIISISSDEVFGNSGLNIGSAETRPKEEKYISFWTGKLRSVAKQKGRNEEIIAGMADADVEIEDIKEKGKLLNLTSDEALEHGIIDKIINSREELYDYLHIDNSNVIETEYDFKTQIARFTNSMTVSSILIALGIIGIVGEIFVAGFGALGSLGILSFALFFAGKMFAGQAGWGILVLFAAGLVLLFIEAAVPGFGIPGISGICCIIVSIIISSGDPYKGAASLIIGIILSIVALFLILKFAPRSKYFDRIILRRAQTNEEGYLASDVINDFVGKEGETLTLMRPSGSIIVEGKKYDAISEGEYIKKGARIRIIRVDGSKIIVQKNNDI
jgi:membrane-bound serine protease (ClpP class)